MTTLEEIAAHVGVNRLQKGPGQTPESDESMSNRLEEEIDRRQRQGRPMPVAAQTLTPVQAAIKQTVLDLTASRDNVPLEDIIQALGTPASEMEQALPAILPMVLPILRRMALDGMIVLTDDERPQPKRPGGTDPLKGLRRLVSRANPAVVAPKDHDTVDLLYDRLWNKAYIRSARLSYDRIAALVMDETFERMPIGDTGISLDFDPEGGFVGAYIDNADTRLTEDTLNTATEITM